MDAREIRGNRVPLLLCNALQLFSVMWKSNLLQNNGVARMERKVFRLKTVVQIRPAFVFFQLNNTNALALEQTLF